MIIKNKSGFTLIELLVVMAIIGVLSSIIFSVISSARIRGRDVKRIQDLKQIQTALAMYYNDNGNYPSTGGNWRYSCNSTWNTLQTALAPYMQTLPVDPLNTPCGGVWILGNYSYVYMSNGGSKYDLITALEDTTSPYRCGIKRYLYHDSPGNETVWCTGGYNYSNQIYADH